MKVEQILCDECKRIRQEANHWMKIGVLNTYGETHERGAVQLTLGVVPVKEMPNYEVHDICGQQCFHKHIDKLLGNPVTPDPTPETVAEEIPFDIRPLKA